MIRRLRLVPSADIDGTEILQCSEPLTLSMQFVILLLTVWSGPMQFGQLKRHEDITLFGGAAE
jgi:hypothetical protein